MLERFIREYSERGYQFAFHLCGSAETAQELLQEAFFRVVKKWGSYDPGLPIENWFLTILRHVYYDGLKRCEHRRAVSLDAPVEEGELSFSEVVADRGEEDLLARLERQESAELVRGILDSLSPEHRAILALCDMQGLTYEEISAVLDCPLGTVRSRINRARLAFKKKMLERMSEVQV